MAVTNISSTGQMEAVANKVEEIIKTYDQAVSKMYDIGQEVDAMWDGDASQKFLSIMGTDREKFVALRTMLTSYVEVLREDIRIYVDAERQAVDTLNTNKIR